MKNKYKKKNIFIIILLSINICLIVGLLYLLSPMSSDDKEVTFIVSEGESLSEISKNLKEKGLIRNDKFFMGYAVLKNSKGIYAAKYKLNKNMSLNEIIRTLKKGGQDINEITITFKEGLNMREIANVIAKETNNSAGDVLSLSNDEQYVNEQIKKYWFLTNDIKNNNIYYDLEGYLFPDTYNFYSKSVSVKEIFDSMLAHTNKKLEKYKNSIEKSNYSVHQIITMASIVELEGVDKSSRKDVAGVFYNRLNNGMPLGSDVTTYYGVKKDMTSDLTQSEIDSANGYNTRNTSMAGKLPVGPICNPSIDSIDAVLKPTNHEYLYFVADKNGKVYLTKNYETHNKVIADLKSKGLWLEW